MAESRPPLADKLILITGATSGIGAAAATEARRAGRRAGRRGSRPAARRAAPLARTARRHRQRALGAARRRPLAVQSDVRRVAGEFKERHDRLDVLINNAGGVFGSRRLTADGLELTFALDHLAYFLLTTRTARGAQGERPGAYREHLLGRLGPRAHRLRRSAVERGYKPFRAYSNAKLANILFTFELARRLEGSGVTANCVHPGFVSTGFGAGPAAPLRLGTRAAQVFARRPRRAPRRSCTWRARPRWPA